MSRIELTFNALKQQGKTGLVTFVTAGDPGPDVTVPIMHALVAGGATCWNSASRSPTRWRKARSSSVPANARWPSASA